MREEEEAIVPTLTNNIIKSGDLLRHVLQSVSSFMVAHLRTLSFG